MGARIYKEKLLPILEISVIPAAGYVSHDKVANHSRDRGKLE
jgi:hypothetical protein